MCCCNASPQPRTTVRYRDRRPFSHCQLQYRARLQLGTAFSVVTAAPREDSEPQSGAGASACQHNSAQPEGLPRRGKRSPQRVLRTPFSEFPDPSHRIGGAAPPVRAGPPAPPPHRAIRFTHRSASRTAQEATLSAAAQRTRPTKCPRPPPFARGVPRRRRPILARVTFSPACQR